MVELPDNDTERNERVAVAAHLDPRSGRREGAHSAPVAHEHAGPPQSAAAHVRSRTAMESRATSGRQPSPVHDVSATISTRTDLLCVIAPPPLRARRSRPARASAHVTR
jgi:hypothetical protein